MSTAASPAAGLHTSCDRVLRWLEDTALAVAGVVMVAAMFLTATDATLRYAFNAPLTFQQYLTENYLLVAMTNLSFAAGFRMGGYIRIEGILHQFPSAIVAVLLRIGLLVSAVYMAVLAWTAGVKFLDFYLRGAVVFGEIDWPISWSWVWVPIGCGLLALRLLLTAAGPARDLIIRHSAEDPV
jgi:TRAP-type C4-dicarboxylate transport system permease small subunit